MTETPTQSVTYLGVPAKVKEIRQGGRAGLREVRILWLGDSGPRNGNHPAGTVVSRTIKGNFTKGTGVVVVPEHVVTEF